MANPKNPSKTAEADPRLEQRRRETLAALESLHGTRRIGAEEYRRRAEVARRAVDQTELEAVTPTRAERGPAPPGAPSPTAPMPPVAARASTAPTARAVGRQEETGFAIALMGGSTRKGAWEPPETLYALALMGGIELDFRQAALLEGVTEVVVVTIMGGVKIVVPDDVDVEVNGIGLMGGFAHVSHHGPGAGRPLIRVRGVALMAGVEVKVKPPGSVSS
jgi:hypothetical protein